VARACEKWEGLRIVTVIRPPTYCSHFIQRWQARVTQPLWLLLAQAELRQAMEEGRVQRERLDTDGWEEWVHD